MLFCSSLHKDIGAFASSAKPTAFLPLLFGSVLRSCVSSSPSLRSCIGASSALPKKHRCEAKKHRCEAKKHRCEAKERKAKEEAKELIQRCEEVKLQMCKRKN
uniref:Uncharacterized protein n=1 Tax=Pediastrum duplex TaxID=3105 RepID=A0A2U8GIV7_PEDDU|nr:hypothetical protein [Pediastrum duplex]